MTMIFIILGKYEGVERSLDEIQNIEVHLIRLRTITKHKGIKIIFNMIELLRGGNQMSRIALVGENSIKYINILLDIWNSGNCAVLLDWRIPMSTAYEMMEKAKVTKCYIDESVSKKITNSDYPNVEFIEYQSNGNVAVRLPNEIYNKFIDNYTGDEAVVIYSSGTTGKSKGVILSHFAINTNADAIQNYMDLTSDDCLYICKSLSHSSSLIGEMLVALKYKIPIVVAPTIVPPRFVLDNIAGFKVTTLCLNPTLLKMYSEEVQRKSYEISSLRTIYVSGSILTDKLYEISHNAFYGVPIYNVYGLSEAGPRVTAQRADCCKNNSVGKPIKSVEIAVIGDDGQVLPNGSHGIVHINTQTIYSGYISGGEKNKTLYKGWLNSGDIGFIDENGELHIADRIDDLIIINAHKICPSDVERVILENTMVTECIVTDYVITKTNTVSLGCVYVSKTDLSVKDIRQLGKILSSYEIPRYYLRVKELPKNRNGKILRNEVAKQLVQGRTDEQ